MLVGESFAMKTASYRILQSALTDMNADGGDEFKTKVYVLNPKSITMQQLYGADDPGKCSDFTNTALCTLHGALIVCCEERVAYRLYVLHVFSLGDL